MQSPKGKRKEFSRKKVLHGTFPNFTGFGCLSGLNSIESVAWSVTFSTSNVFFKSLKVLAKIQLQMEN